MNDESEVIQNVENKEKHNPKVRKRDLSNDERAGIIQFLLERSENKVLRRGAIKQAAEAFKVHRRSITRVWQRGLASLERGSLFMDGSTLKKGKCGRKKINYQPYIDAISKIPLDKRTSLRSTASALGVSKSTLYRRLKDGDFRKHNCYIKPGLKRIKK